MAGHRAGCDWNNTARASSVVTVYGKRQRYGRREWVAVDIYNRESDLQHTLHNSIDPIRDEHNKPSVIAHSVGDLPPVRLGMVGRRTRLRALLGVRGRPH